MTRCRKSSTSPTSSLSIEVNVGGVRERVDAGIASESSGHSVARGENGGRFAVTQGAPSRQAELDATALSRPQQRCH